MSQKFSRARSKTRRFRFKLKQGFRIIAVVDDYLDHDRESLGKAAIIEWLNQKAINEIKP